MNYKNRIKELIQSQKWEVVRHEGELCLSSPTGETYILLKIEEEEWSEMFNGKKECISYSIEASYFKFAYDIEQSTKVVITENLQEIVDPETIKYIIETYNSLKGDFIRLEIENKQKNLVEALEKTLPF
tara:strand:- start:88867 stop:89253 length:387 start_codon:yes stop_codon:yes gene_type:complete